MPSNNSSKTTKYGLGTVGGEEFDCPLPSGNVARVRKAQPEDLIFAGLLDSVDALTALVQDLHVDRVLKGKAGKAAQKRQQTAAVIELIKDRKRWEALQDLMNAITVYCVVEPAVAPVPAPGEKREPDVLYIDKVSLLDKMTIMSAALADAMAGMGAMEPFRGEPTETVGSVADVTDVPESAERAGGDKQPDRRLLF